MGHGIPPTSPTARARRTSAGAVGIGPAAAAQAAPGSGAAAAAPRLARGNWGLALLGLGPRKLKTWLTRLPAVVVVAVALIAATVVYRAGTKTSERAGALCARAESDSALLGIPGKCTDPAAVLTHEQQSIAEESRRKREFEAEHREIVGKLGWRYCRQLREEQKTCAPLDWFSIASRTGDTHARVLVVKYKDDSGFGNLLTAAATGFVLSVAMNRRLILVMPREIDRYVSPSHISWKYNREQLRRHLHLHWHELEQTNGRPEAAAVDEPDEIGHMVTMDEFKEGLHIGNSGHRWKSWEEFLSKRDGAHDDAIFWMEGHGHNFLHEALAKRPEFIHDAPRAGLSDEPNVRACILRLLMRPRDELASLILRVIGKNVLLPPPGVVNDGALIAVHARRGDESFGMAPEGFPMQPGSMHARAYWQCTRRLVAESASRHVCQASLPGDDRVNVTTVASAPRAVGRGFFGEPRRRATTENSVERPTVFLAADSGVVLDEGFEYLFDTARVVSTREIGPQMHTAYGVLDKSKYEKTDELPTDERDAGFTRILVDFFTISLADVLMKTHSTFSDTAAEFGLVEPLGRIHKLAGEWRWAWPWKYGEKFMMALRNVFVLTESNGTLTDLAVCAL